MYVTDTAGQQQQQSKPGFPTYDVKIIAGRRVVIFHDKKPENQPFEDLQKLEERTQQNEEKATKDLENEDHSSCIHLTEDIVLSEEENEEKENMLAPKAASVPSSRSRNQSSASVPPHPGFHNPRKLSLSDTFTVKSFEDTKYPILPPLTKPIEASEVDSGVKEALKGVNERSLEAMLREMRKLDRDRDGVLPPANIHKFMDKFQVRIQGLILDHLYQRFVDNRFPDMINYEALMKYLLKMKTSIENVKKESEPPPESLKTSSRQVSASPKDQSGIFGDRGDARLILDLEGAISDSPNFNLNQFKTSLESKDMYGNEQVSKQHVIQAANHAKLSVNKDVLKRWLSACDPIHRGIYRIPKLISFLERSQPNVIARLKSGKDLSKSHGNLSYGRLKQDSNWVKTPKTPKTLNSSASEIPLGDILKRSLDKSTETLSPRPQNLQDLNYLKQALVRSHQEIPGYLKADDVRHVCSSYSAAFQMNISNSRVQEAISDARTMDPATNLINIGLFCRFLDTAVNK